MIEGIPDRRPVEFSSDDVFALQKILSDHKAKVWNPNPVARYLPQPSLTEISAIGIVRTPTGGIPAMWPANGTGTGTGSAAADDFNNVVGTGSSSVVTGGERPGFADCEADYLSTGTASGRYLNHPRIVRKGETITVYNPSFEPIPGNVYIPVSRDGFGVWWVSPLPVVPTGSASIADTALAGVTLSNGAAEVVIIDPTLLNIFPTVGLYVVDFEMQYQNLSANAAITFNIYGLGWSPQTYPWIDPAPLSGFSQWIRRTFFVSTITPNPSWSIKASQTGATGGIIVKTQIAAMKIG